MKEYSKNRIFNIIENIEKGLKEAVIELGIENPTTHIEHPDDVSHGDFSSNIALIYAKEL